MSSNSDGRLPDTAPSSPAPTPAAGVGSGRGNGTNNNRNRRNHRRGGRGQGQGHFRRDEGRKRFEGAEPTLHGFIYDFQDERNPDQWIRTTREIGNYIGRTMKKNTTDFIEAVRTLELVDPAEPANPSPDDVVAFEKWKLAIKRHEAKVEEYADFRAFLYSTVMGQCTETMQSRLKSHVDFPKVSSTNDGIALLKIIKAILHTFEERQNLFDALLDVKEKFYSMRQGKHQTLQQYHDRFMAHVGVLEDLNVNLVDDKMIEAVAAEHGRTMDEATLEDKKEARNRLLAVRFVRGVNSANSGYLLHLRNSFLDGQDYYPETVYSAFNILQRRIDERPAPVESDGVAFAQGRGEEVTCYACGEQGHIAPNCPSRNNNNNIGDEQSRTQNGANMCLVEVSSSTLCTAGVENHGCSTNGFSFSQGGFRIPKTWILLDNQSTVDLFCNADLLMNIRSRPPEW